MQEIRERLEEKVLSPQDVLHEAHKYNSRLTLAEVIYSGVLRLESPTRNTVVDALRRKFPREEKKNQKTRFERHRELFLGGYPIPFDDYSFSQIDRMLDKREAVEDYGKGGRYTRIRHEFWAVICDDNDKGKREQFEVKKAYRDIHQGDTIEILGFKDDDLVDFVLKRGGESIQKSLPMVLLIRILEEDPHIHEIEED